MTHHNFCNIFENFLSLVLLESMAKWNTKVENISEKRRIKIEKKWRWKFQLFIQSRCSLQNLIAKISILSDHENFFFFWFFLLKNWIKQLYFRLWSNLVYINSWKNSAGIDVFFSVKQLINNDTLGSRESVIYHFTFNFNFIAPFYGWGPTASRL